MATKNIQKLLFRKEWADFIKAEFGDDVSLGFRVYNAVVDYFYDNVVPEDRVIKLAIGTIMKQIDADKEDYEARAERNRINGRRGGNPNFKKGVTNPYYNNENITENNPMDIFGNVEKIDEKPITEGLCSDNQTDIKDNPIMYSNELCDNSNKKEKTINGKKQKSETVMSEEEIEFYKNMETDYPYICKFEQPLTLVEYNKLIVEYGIDVLTHTLGELNNYKPATKNYRNAYRTLNNWCKNNIKKFSKNGTTIKSNQPKPDIAEAVINNIFGGI